MNNKQRIISDRRMPTIVRMKRKCSIHLDLDLQIAKFRYANNSLQTAIPKTPGDMKKDYELEHISLFEFKYDKKILEIYFLFKLNLNKPKRKVFHLNSPRGKHNNLLPLRAVWMSM